MESSQQKIAKLARQLSQQLAQLAESIEGDFTPEKQATFTCPSCGLEKEFPMRRGICRTCYARIQQQIQRGKLTDEQAVAAGLLSADRQLGGKKPTVKTALDKYLEADNELPKLVDELVEKSKRKGAKK